MKTPSSARIEVIDVLRGFALLCIVLVHFSGEFAGWSSVYTSPVSSASLPASGADSAVNFILNAFLINKGRTLFAFLFGVGFYFQLAKASRNGYRIEGRFARRMGMLFVIGLLHAYLLWAGDILRFYALCGMVLLLVYKRSPRFLFGLAVVCSVLIPALSVWLHYHIPFSTMPGHLKVQMYEGFVSKEYTGFLHANLLRDVVSDRDPFDICFFLFPVFGNFLFGYLAAQLQLFRRLTESRLFLYRSLLVSFAAGFLCSNSFVRLAAKPFGATENDLPAFWRDVLILPNSLSVEGTAFFLLCGVVYLYQTPLTRKVLFSFSYAGRMTLTNYIMQSLFGVWFFFGVGLGFISRYGPAVGFAIGLAYFAFQVMYSRLWLHYFSTGPVEYLWRSVVERKWQPLRRIRPDMAM